MFLKNWDMTRLKLITASAADKSINEDQDGVFRYYNGKYGSFNISSGDSQQILNYSLYIWSNSGYPNQDVDYGHFIWPGGDVNGVPARIRPSMEKNNIKYEDFDLYSPFYGGTAPGSGQIYGQPHNVTSATYNTELDQWEKTVTREFKNISGHTITIRELGFYVDRVLMAREILDTPIEVQNDGYFKMSFTYRVENPHEHRTVKRIKQYSRTFYFDYYNSSTLQADRSFSLDKNNGRVLMIAKWCHSSRPNSIDNYYLDFQGWTGKEIVEPILAGNSNSNNNFFTTRIYILTPEDGEDNSIRMTNSTRYDGRYNCTYVFLKDNISDITSQPIQGENYFIDLEFSNDTEITLNKTALEKNIIWLALSNPYHNTPNFYQKDTNFCDYDYVNGVNETSLFFDDTDATEHTIGFSHYYQTDTHFRSYVFLKLKAIMKDNTPLYEDIPVQR